MGKLGKVIGIIVLFIFVAIAGLIAFVHYYLTEERVKALIIPQAEAALGREVAIGDIKIGLLSGITIRDFLIKEADKETNFVSTKAFVLSYELLPLLQKKLIISEIRFDEPAVQITRNKNGQFNFSTLAFLTDEQQKKKAAKPKPASAALPLALTINQIKFNKARIKIQDQLGEIPAVNATTSAKLNIALGRTMKDLQYNGSFDFDAAVAYGEAQTKLIGKADISQKGEAIEIKLHKTQIAVQELLNKIPAVNATTSAKLNATLGQTMDDLQYNGTFDFDAAIAYGEAQTKLIGKADISQKNKAIEIKLHKTQIAVQELLNKIPAVNATTSAKLNATLGQTMGDLQYNGTFDFDAAVAYGEAQSKLIGKGNINQNDMDIILDTDLDGEQVHAEADVKSFMQSPNATIAISSKSLNIDKLLGIAAGLPKTQTDTPAKPQTAPGKSADIIADSLPPGLVAKGTMKVDKALYKGLTANNFSLAFNLDKGILRVKDLSANAYNGKIDSSVTVDLNQPGPAYDGNIGLQSIQAADFSSALIQRLAGMLTGSLQSAVSFSGAGTSWQQISRVLTANGDFMLTDGGIKGTPVFLSISNLLGLQELNNISYKNISGTFKIVDGGKVKIKTNMKGADLDAEAEGIIGLDGSLDLPLTFHLSPALADKLRSRASFAKYLTGEQGGTTLHLKLVGNLKSPKPTLDMKGVQDKLQKSLKKEIFKKLDNSGQDSDQKTSPENIIKGLFNR